MGRYWWLTWVKVAAVLLVFAVLIGIGYYQLKRAFSDYLIEAPEGTPIYRKIDYENLVFDMANDYVEKMVEESEQERNAITETLS